MDSLPDAFDSGAEAKRRLEDRHAHQRCTASRFARWAVNIVRLGLRAASGSTRRSFAAPKGNGRGGDSSPADAKCLPKKKTGAAQRNASF